MKFRHTFLAAAAVACLFSPEARAALGDGLIAYWPLDEIQGTRTPDLVNGYDLTLSNLTANELVAGKFGKCFSFSASKQTLLSRKANAGDKIPANDLHNAWSVALWVKGTGTGQSDLRVFSEGSTDNSTPLFNIGTDSGGASDSVDIFIRGNNGTVNHPKSSNVAFDNTWRLIVWTQEGNDKVTLYLDGVKDEIDIAAGVSPLSNAGNTYKVNTTSIGGILRASPSHWWTGLIDDVAEWQRALTPAEVTQLFKEGMSGVKFGGSADPLANGMIAYWPLDELVSSKAPELVNGYDLTAANLTAADVVPGKWGKAFSFTASKQTLLSRKANPGDKIPANDLHNAWSVALWVKGTGTGQSDLRVFSEGSTDNSTPLFNIGTDSGGASDSVDIFIRGNNGTVNHPKSTNMAFDNVWRHIVWTQNGNDKVTLYVDAVKDEIDIAAGVSPLSNAGNTYKVNTTSIGGILRASPSHWWTGLIDDVAEWQRELSADEVKTLFTKGTPKPAATALPLEIKSFVAERAKAAAGTKAIFTWEGSKDATYDINGQDVTPQTQFGTGRAEFVITQDTKYVLTAKRGGESKTKELTVKVLSGVQPGWFLLDDFETGTGALGVVSGGTWPEPDSAKLRVITQAGNRVVGEDAGQAMAFTRLGSYQTPNGATRTYYFHLYLKDDSSPIEATIGVTQKTMRFANNENEMDLGGFIVVRRADGAKEGEIGIGPATNENFSKTKIAPGVWHKVWLDITNSPGANTDTISVHIAKGGEARTTLFTKEQGDAGWELPHAYFFFAPRQAITSDDAILIDNVFISEGTTALATDPLGSGGGPVVGPGDSDGDGQSDASEVLAGTDPKNPADWFRVVKIETTAKGGKVTWDAKAGKTYEIEYSETLSGGWTVVGPNLTGTGATSWEDNDAGRLAKAKGFYRVKVK